MANNHSDPNALLDKFTQILAYVGDDGAKDGYYLRTNNSGNPIYSIDIRSEELTPKEIDELVKQIKSLLKKNKPVKEFEQDIIDKTNELKASYEDTRNQSAKKELIDYINDFEGNSGMRGGKRRNTRRRKTKRNRRKSLKTRKL
jgi:transposase